MQSNLHDKQRPLSYAIYIGVTVRLRLVGFWLCEGTLLLGSLVVHVVEPSRMPHTGSIVQLSGARLNVKIPLRMTRLAIDVRASRLGWSGCGSCSFMCLGYWLTVMYALGSCYVG